MSNTQESLFILLFLGLGIWSCEHEIIDPSIEDETSSIEKLIEEGRAKEIASLPSLIKYEAGEDLQKNQVKDITFSDEDALNLIPNYNSTFVEWPGYAQQLYDKTFGYAWLSFGPGARFLPRSMGGKHFHIFWDNFCINPSDGSTGKEASGYCYPIDLFPIWSVDRYHEAMYGHEWLGFYARSQESGGIKKNFDLERIRVRGSVPITLWFKKADGSWNYWKKLNPGYYNLSAHTQNIQEFHIRAESDNPADKYRVDDVRMIPLP